MMKQGLQAAPQPRSEIAALMKETPRGELYD
jgi:hypothetical protein